jgi:predicted homoserine dehydrogenase-like protein
MNTATAALAEPVRRGLAGAGRMGTSHATLLACIESVATATPVLVDKADPR